MTRARTLTVLVALGGALAASPPAFARAWRVSEIPNGSVNTCYTCHIQIYPYGQWNAFGMDLRTNYGINGPGAPPVPWSKVYNTDSDGDGQTNGQELGDPCGVWTSGCAPQFTTGVSNPGIASSTTSTIPTCANAGKAPACGGSGGGSDGGSQGPPPTPSGCNTAPGSAGLGAFLLVALAGLVVRRRGRLTEARR